MKPADRDPPASRLVVFLLGLAVAIAVAIGHRQLLQPVALTTRDHTDFYLRVHEYRQELADGHWPQNLPHALRGGGHAFPRFYPPLAHAAALGGYAITDDVVAATHLAGLASIILAGVACFVMLLSLTSRVLPSAIGAAVYALMPYPFIALDIRGSFAETWGMVFYPPVFLGLVNSLRKRHPPWWLPLAVAGLLASHLVMTAWTLPVLLLVAVYVAAPGLTWQALAGAGGACLTGFALMAPFILQSLSGLDGVRASDPVIMLSSPEQVAGFVWPFDQALLGTFGVWNQFGWLMLIFGIAGLWLTRKDPSFTRRLCWAGLAGYGLLASFTRAPVEVWRLIPQSFRYIQFPDRLLGPASFCFALTLAAATSWLKSRYATILLATLGVLVALFGYELGGMILPRSGETGKAVLTRLDTPYPDRGLTVKGEYLPLGSEPEQLAQRIQATLDGVGREPLLEWRRAGGGYSARVKVSRPTQVPLPLVAYDFHRVTSNGAPVVTGMVEGQLTAQVEAGTIRLIIDRRLPLSLKLGVVISGITLLVLVLRGIPFHLSNDTR